MLQNRVKCAVPNPGMVNVGSTVTLGAAPVGFRSWLVAFGAAAPAYFVLSDGAGRALSGVWTVNATVPETATITQILANDRLGGAAGETFSSACVAFNALPVQAPSGQVLSAPTLAAMRTALGATTVGGAVFTAADAAAARAAIGGPAPPQTAAGLGQFTALEAASGAAAVLPAGGTWAYWITQVSASTAAWSTFRAAGVSAGGTTVGAASAGQLWYGFCWRIA